MHFTLPKRPAAAIDLEAFCGHQLGTRYRLDKPFVQAQRRYATDGAITVSIPAEGAPDTQSSRLKPFPPMNRVFDLWPIDCEWKPWPDVRLVHDEVPCPTCGGHWVKPAGHQVIPELARKFAIDAKYDALIRRLSDVRYAVLGQCVYFTFADDGLGAVMPREMEAP